MTTAETFHGLKKAPENKHSNWREPKGCDEGLAMTVLDLLPDIIKEDTHIGSRQVEICVQTTDDCLEKSPGS